MKTYRAIIFLGRMVFLRTIHQWWMWGRRNILAMIWHRWIWISTGRGGLMLETVHPRHVFVIDNTLKRFNREGSGWDRFAGEWRRIWNAWRQRGWRWTGRVRGWRFRCACTWWRKQGAVGLTGFRNVLYVQRGGQEFPKWKTKLEALELYSINAAQNSGICRIFIFDDGDNLPSLCIYNNN